MTPEKIQKIKDFEKALNDFVYFMNEHIVWEPQEGQEDHFDKYNKSEKIALIDIFAKARGLSSAINDYNRWFNN